MVGEAAPSWRRVVGSVRFRITALATLAVVVVLALTGVALIVQTRSTAGVGCTAGRVERR